MYGPTLLSGFGPWLRLRCKTSEAGLIAHARGWG